MKQHPGMQGDIRELQRLREKIATARIEALRLGQTRLASILARSMAAIDLTIEELSADCARTQPQIDALKRLIGAT